MDDQICSRHPLIEEEQREEVYGQRVCDDQIQGQLSNDHQ